ncbi:transcriptional regulator ArgP [Mycobacteroides chelonae]|uniref:LysR family transcriptional regulator ArgP n=1 Tax=Mycobacteroides chelonae TaxID=1774 RepID=UPI0008A8A265|nr:LysR family transcriptional regulator ArgP [Mycobacteroides chelonae]OHT79336.1 transcriptional regulator ArgP [Mycobacteroides chelonae]
MREKIETRLDAGQLAALAAVIEFGSFDTAASQLRLTPSAVSQRIKALEQHVGQILIVREKPCKATAAGIPLVRLAAQTAILESEALADAGVEMSTERRVAIAVNADSMATWFPAVLGAGLDVLFDIRIEDQDLSSRFLREGVVMGAVTTERVAVPGCRVRRLGAMRYVPVASPEYLDRYLAGGFTADSVAAAPSLAWSRDDGLQDQLVRKAFRRPMARRVHYVPSTEGFAAAVSAGLGWGMYPELLVKHALSSGEFVRATDLHLDVPLFWQSWKLDSTVATSVSDAVVEAARALV